MRRRGTALGLGSLAALLGGADLAAAVPCAVPADRPTITAALLDATCDPIVLAFGTYPEGPLLVARSVTIQGPNVTVPASGFRFVEATITSTQEGIVLDGGAITLAGVEVAAAGIAVMTGGGAPLAVTLSNCLLSGPANITSVGAVTLVGNRVLASNQSFGLRVNGSGPEGVIVRDNLVEHVANGAGVDSDDVVGIRVAPGGPVEISGNVVRDTLISSNADPVRAVGIDVVTGADGAVVRDNRVTGTGCDLSVCTSVGIHASIDAASGGSVEVLDNVVEDTYASGSSFRKVATGIDVEPDGPVRVARNSVRATLAASDVSADATALRVLGAPAAIVVEGNRVSTTVANGVGGGQATGNGILASVGTADGLFVTGNEIRETYALGLTAGQDASAYGIQANNSDGPVTVTDNVLDGFDGVGVLTIGASDVTVRGNVVENGGRIGVALAGGAGDGTVEGNVVRDIRGPGIRLTDGFAPPLTLRARGNLVERAFGAAIEVSPYHPLAPGFAGTIEVSENTLVDSSFGLLFDETTDLDPGAQVSAHFNRIAGNLIGGINHQGRGAVDATNNWFGCNEGPGQAGCDPIFVINSLVASVDADPWLQLDVTGEPSGPLTCLVAASLTRNSDGTDTSAEGHLPDGTAIALATTFGTLPDTAETTGGVATASLSSESAGNAVVTAALDGASVSTLLDVAKREMLSGKRLLLKSGATKQAMQLVSKDTGFTLGDGAASGDDPTVSGGSLRLRWSVGSVPAFEQTYELPAASWRAIGKEGPPKGYRLLATPPFTQVLVKPGKTLKIVGSGSFGFSLEAEPDFVDVVLTLGNLRYCMTFGGEATFAPGRKYVAKDAPVTSLCPVASFEPFP